MRNLVTVRSWSHHSQSRLEYSDAFFIETEGEFSGRELMDIFMKSQMAMIAEFFYNECESLVFTLELPEVDTFEGDFKVLAEMSGENKETDMRVHVNFVDGKIMNLHLYTVYEDTKYDTHYFDISVVNQECYNANMEELMNLSHRELAEKYLLLAFK